MAASTTALVTRVVSCFFIRGSGLLLSCCDPSGRIQHGGSGVAGRVAVDGYWRRWWRCGMRRQTGFGFLMRPFLEERNELLAQPVILRVFKQCRALARTRE